MKKILSTLIAGSMMLALFMAVGTPQAKAQNNNGWIGIAHSAPGINTCLQDARANGWTVDANVAMEPIACLIPPCPQQYVVTFYGRYNCPPNQICPLALVIIAQVRIDENRNIISYTCFRNNQI